MESRAGSLPRPGVGRAALRVLVVDDFLDAAATLGLLLRLWGHEVRLAGSGPEALSASPEFRPHLVLSELRLRGLDGLEVARRFRETEGPRPVLVALTTRDSDADRQRAHSAGFDHYFLKPLDPADLQKLLARCAPPETP